MGKPCHFAQFDLQPAFLVDLDELGQRYRELVRSVHPGPFRRRSRARAASRPGTRGATERRPTRP
ncbi:hypothetical protein ACPA9J_13420 [Pseudomonas aeruginosa]